MNAFNTSKYILFCIGSKGNTVELLSVDDNLYYEVSF